MIEIKDGRHVYGVKTIQMTSSPEPLGQCG